MYTKYAVGVNEYKGMTTAELRETFLIDQLFNDDTLDLMYCEVERAVIGSAVPTDNVLELKGGAVLAANYFCERRELGVLNLGGAGVVIVDGERYEMDTLDGLYIGRGSQGVTFESHDSAQPAKFYLASYPAHQSFPTTLAKKTDAASIDLGSVADCNERTIYQYIHEDGIQSCQLLMGFTRLKEGNCWNTMPAHTHERRTEVYLYFDIADESAVFHFMGPKDETRHIAVHNLQAAISPMWSIHSGCGTRNYSFAWVMGGENQRFDDMDFIPIEDLR